MSLISGNITSIVTAGLFYPSTGAIPDQPDAPVISVTTSGTTATISVVCSAGAVKVYKRTTSDSTWVLAGTRTNSGTVAYAVAYDVPTMFVATVTVSSVQSTMSNLVSVTITDITADGFCDYLTGDDVMMDTLYNEYITYQPHSGDSRSIKAIVDRTPPDDIMGGRGVTPVASVTVLNDATSGILMETLDTGQDTISMPARVGCTATTRRIGRIKSQDCGMITLEVL